MPGDSSLYPLRRRLLLLVAAAILPIAAVSGVALYVFMEKQREQAGRAGQEITRALSTAVDAELYRAVAVLEAISTATLLDTGDIAGYHGLARRVAATRRNWQSILLHDAREQMLFSTNFPLGGSLPQTAEPESVALAARTGKPVIGPLARGPKGELAFAVRVPVVRDGEVRYVLSAVVRPSYVIQVVSRQRLPADWVVSVFDSKDQRIARSRQHEENLGTAPAPSLKEMMARGGEEAYGFTRTLEGEAVYTAYSRSRQTGWTVAIGVPASLIDAAALRSFAAYGTGILLSIALGVLAAVGMGRGITRPMEELREAARALGRREPLAPPMTPIAEIHQVAESLQTAADERARGEAELEALLERAQEARATAEAANRAKDEFLALLGHELRNPLGAIMNAARLLEHPAIGDDDKARARAIIGRQAEHLSRLTDDLLDAGRAIMGKVVLELRPLDLAIAAEQAVATLRSSGKLGKHRVSQDLQSAWVQGDATRLEQIISNLVMNAVKYTPAGGAISISVRREGGDAALRIADNGIGMRGELLSRVFEPFVQGEPGLDRSAGGLGLGLTLVRQLAALHGGSASAASEGPGRGSTFTVRLPAIEPRVSPARGSGAAPSAPQRDILIVEDNADARETLRRLLELQGHRVRVAAEGTAALEAVRAAPPEVALIDIGLPGMDGYEIARRLRADGAGRDIYLIALTGYGLTEDRRRTAEAGFDLHLVKPVDYAKLEEALRA